MTHPSIYKLLSVLMLSAVTLTFGYNGAQAQSCSGPNGTEGTIIYNAQHKVAQFCNGTDWIGMAGGATSVMQGDTISAGLPDAIACMSPSSMRAVFYNIGFSGTTAYYRYIDDPSNSSERTITYNMTNGNYAGNTNMIGYDCVTNAWSIAQLYASGRAYNFVGGGTDSGGGGTADNLGNHIVMQNLNLNGHWLSGDGGNTGIKIGTAGDVSISNGQLITANPNGAMVFNSGPAGTSELTGFWFRSNNALGGYIAPYTDLMRITDEGNVGIGTIYPQARLQVSGNIIASDPTADNHVATKAYVDSQSGGGGHFLGEIKMVPYNKCPVGWVSAQGQLLSIAAQPDLFSLLGVMYGGNGITTFALPDLRSRTPVGIGQGPGLDNIVQGQLGGQHEKTLILSNMPSHSHTASTTIKAGTGAPTTGATGRILSSQAAIYTDATDPTVNMSPNGAATLNATAGTSAAVNIRNPFIGMRWCIAMTGQMPQFD